MLSIFTDLLSYIESGGYVMWPLIVATFILWYGLGYRYHAMNRGNKRSVRILLQRLKREKQYEPQGVVDAAVINGIKLSQKTPQARLRRVLDDAFFIYEQEISRYSVLVKTIVIVAPLAGLLGTVIGMIETFDSLGSMQLFSQSGGIAGGISQALFTTQMGLVVAVPGLVVGRLLDKKQYNIEMELAQIKDILCSEEKETES
jgi:biopolymer transport protein ExbB